MLKDSFYLKTNYALEFVHTKTSLHNPHILHAFR